MKFSTTLLFLLPCAMTFFLSCRFQEKAIIADGEELILISDDFEFTEGPAADSSGNVFFTDQPNNKILRWSAVDNSISVYLGNAGRANGLYFDNAGNLLACADENSELWRIDDDKNITVLVEDFKGKRLNGPNDLWVDSEGGIYFTDPYYQRPYWERTEKEIESDRVYYRTPDGKEVKIVADDYIRPNGIVGTADGKTLYVADIGNDKTFSYTITEDGSLINKKLFTALGSDGMTIDNKGNVYLTGEGVQVFNKNGKKVHQIPVDQKWTTNVAFGGTNHQTLFITAMNAVYTLNMNVKGVRY